MLCHDSAEVLVDLRGRLASLPCIVRRFFAGLCALLHMPLIRCEPLCIIAPADAVHRAIGIHAKKPQRIAVPAAIALETAERTPGLAAVRDARRDDAQRLYSAAHAPQEIGRTCAQGVCPAHDAVQTAQNRD